MGFTSRRISSRTISSPSISSRWARSLGVAGALALAIPGATALADPGPAPGITVETLHFAVNVGPDGATACDVVGDLYRPAGASAQHPVAAILTTNGFGGSKDDQAPMARMLAGRGYAVLSYSGLGFGGSTCKVTLDDPRYDGAAASQLVGFLGGRDGVAFADPEHRTPLPGADFITRDDITRDDVTRDDAAAHDPRVGMVGGSYGGQIQFAAASADPRIDTIVPMITWNDLGYSLAPNSLSPNGIHPTPGVFKAGWGDQLALAGMLSPLADGGYTADPLRALPCPNFTEPVCPALAGALATGWPDEGAAALFENVSVARYLDRITIPTLLIQGQNDTLFNLNEARATYDGLSARGVEVKMIWQLGGHSGPGAPGELDPENPDPDAQYVAGRVVDWLDRHLLGTTVDTGPAFAYFQDWVQYTGDAAPAYAAADSPQVGTPTTLTLSADGVLAGGAGAGGASEVAPGSMGLTTGVSGLPVPPPPGVPSRLPVPLPQFSVPGTTAEWASGPLTAPVTVVGAPALALSVSSDPGGDGSLPLSTVLFAQILDIGPDGTASTIHDLVAPIRLLESGGPIHVTLPGIVHRFEAGHRIGLSLSGGNAGFRGNLVSHQVEFAIDGGQTLTLPVIG